MNASQSRSRVKTLESAITHFLEREINRGSCDTGKIYRRVQDAFPHSPPEQIERCARELAEQLKDDHRKAPSMGF